MSSKQTRQKMIDYLLQLLPSKGEQAYEKFVTCLESEKEHLPHMELAVKMKKTAEEMKKSIPVSTYLKLSYSLLYCLICKRQEATLSKPASLAHTCKNNYKYKKNKITDTISYSKT